MDLSIIIPVHNRAWCIERALHSARNFLWSLGAGEIIVVDDGSTDDSVNVVERYCAQERTNALVDIRLVRLNRNKGVCAAKNAGAMEARNTWLVFLDSDDELLSEAALPMVEAIGEFVDSPLHFFPCIGEDGVPVGVRLEHAVLNSCGDFLLKGTGGESLPVIRRDVFLRYPYDEDINGFEGLSYLRILRFVGPAQLHTEIARKYYTSHDSRLSSPVGVRKRARSLALGYRRVLREHWAVLGARNVGSVFLRYMYHRVRALVNR